MPHSSTWSLHCGCHTVLHRVYTVDATQFYTEFTLRMPHSSTPSLHCGCHTALHRVYTVDATQFNTVYTVDATQFTTEFTLQTLYSSTHTLHCRHYTVLHRCYTADTVQFYTYFKLQTLYHTDFTQQILYYTDFKLQTLYSSTQMIYCRHNVVRHKLCTADTICDPTFHWYFLSFWYIYVSVESRKLSLKWWKSVRWSCHYNNLKSQPPQHLILRNQQSVHHTETSWCMFKTPFMTFINIVLCMKSIISDT